MKCDSTYFIVRVRTCEVLLPREKTHKTIGFFEIANKKREGGKGGSPSAKIATKYFPQYRYNQLVRVSIPNSVDNFPRATKISVCYTC